MRTHPPVKPWSRRWRTRLAVAAALSSLVAVSACKLRHQTKLSAADGKEARTPSLFEQVIALAPDRQVPYPFSALLAHLDSFSAPLVVFTPLGRSLQRAAGMPAPFHDPRRLVAFSDPKPSTAYNLTGKVFLGYVAASHQIEVISYNERAGRFDFFVINNYDKGTKPKLELVERSQCVVCHRHEAPLFSVRPWDEFNGNDFLASMINRHHPSGMLDGQPIRQTLSESEGGGQSDAYENLVTNAEFQLEANAVWQSLCTKDMRRCRAEIARAGLRKALGLPSELPADVRRDIDATPRQLRRARNLLKDRSLVEEVFGSHLPEGFVEFPAATRRLDQHAYDRIKASLATEAEASLRRVRAFFENSKRAEQPSQEDFERVEVFMAEQALRDSALSADIDPRQFPGWTEMDAKGQAINLDHHIDRMIAGFTADYRVPGGRLPRLRALLQLPQNRGAATAATLSVYIDDSGKADLAPTISDLDGLRPTDGDKMRDVSGSCRPVDGRSKGDEQECRFTLPVDADDAGIGNLAMTSVTLRLPRQSGGVSSSASTIRLRTTDGIATLAVLCHTQAGFGPQYLCQTLDIQAFERALDQVILHNTQGSGLSLSNGGLNQATVLDEVLVALGATGNVAGDQRADVHGHGASRPGDLRLSDGLQLLFTHCGDCHAADEAVKSKTFPQFLAGADLATICQSLADGRQRAAAAIEDSSMPPEESPRIAEVLADGGKVKSQLLKALADLPGCP